MDMPQVVLTAALFIAHVGGLVACNNTAFNTTHTVTVFTTITPIATNFCLGSNFNKVLPTTNIDTTAPLTNSTTLTPSPTLTDRPFLGLTDALMAYKAALASLTVCEFASGNFSINTTKVCSSTTATLTAPLNILTPANSSTILSTVNRPTPPSQSTNIDAETSTTVVVVSLVTGSSGGVATETITSGSTSTTKPFTTSATSTDTATSTSAAHSRPQPLGVLFWINWMGSKARAQVLKAFGDWANTEKAKMLIGAEGAMRDAVTTATTHPVVPTTASPPTVTKPAAAALLSAPYFLGLAVVILVLS